MDIYNFKPLWIEMVEEQKEELGRELTDEELANIKKATRTSIEMLGLLYNNDNFQNSIHEYRIKEGLHYKLTDNWYQRMAKRALSWHQNLLKFEDIYKGHRRRNFDYSFTGSTTE